MTLFFQRVLLGLSLTLLALVFVLVSSSRSLAADIPIETISSAIQFKVEKFKLENGLTVLLHEDSSTPMITYHQWFRVGSKDEDVGRTGLAHFFEHLMFKGTQKFLGKDFDRMIQANGGSNNAFTSRDYTGYYINMPSDKLELMIDIESDRMVNLLFDPKEIKSEREVVKEERRYRTENTVDGILDEAMFRTVFKVHPYRWPVIGSMADLNAATLEDMKEFYRRYYAPNNAVVVIVGDFKASKARALIEKYYGPIPSQKLEMKTLPKEPKQLGQRMVTLNKDVQSPTVALAYLASASGAADSYAFDLLSNILTSGPSSRLHRRLVFSEQTATSVSSWAYTPKEPGLFQVSASIKPGVDADRVLRALYFEVGKMREQLVSADELQKAKNQIMTDYVQGLKTISGKARALAVNEIVMGDYNELFRDLEKYNRVTAEDIKSVADRYLRPNQRSVFRVLPKSMAAKAQE